MIKRGDLGILKTAAAPGFLLEAVNGWNYNNACIVIEVLEDDCLVVFDLESPLVQQIAAQELGYPMGKGFLKIHLSQFKGDAE